MVGQKPGAKRAVSLLNFGKQDVEEPATRSWQSGPDRTIYLLEGLLAKNEIPEYLTGEVPGDYGCDPLGLSMKSEDFDKYQAYELIHARWAMPGAAGFVLPEAFNKFGAVCGPEAVWRKTGGLLLEGDSIKYFGANIPINLAAAVIAEVILVRGAEFYRILTDYTQEERSTLWVLPMIPNSSSC